MQQYQQVMALAPRPRTKVIPLSHAPSVVLILSWAVKVGPLLGDVTLHSRRWRKRHFHGKIFGKSDFLVHSISPGSVNFTRTPTKVRLIGCSLSASRCDSDLITLTSCVCRLMQKKQNKNRTCSTSHLHLLLERCATISCSKSPLPRRRTEWCCSSAAPQRSGWEPLTTTVPVGSASAASVWFIQTWNPQTALVANGNAPVTRLEFMSILSSTSQSIHSLRLSDKPVGTNVSLLTITHLICLTWRRKTITTLTINY